MTTIAISILIGFLFIGCIILFIYFNSVSKKNQKPSKITYRNLYIGQGSNTHVHGINKYATQEEAKNNQKCPPGYRWHSAIPSRRWV